MLLRSILVKELVPENKCVSIGVNIRVCSQEKSEVKAWQINQDKEEYQGYTLGCEAMCDDPAGFQMSSD